MENIDSILQPDGALSPPGCDGCSESHFRIDPSPGNDNLRRMRTLLGVMIAAVALAGSLHGQEPVPLVTTGTSSYSLRPGDILDITVWGQDSFSGRFQIDENGRILYPMLGEIDTRNLTVEQVRDTLRMGLETLFNNPFLTVRPLFRISVLGHVMSPGLYTIDPTLTAIDVVAMAGGPTSSGNLNSIRVLRSDGESTVDFENRQLRGMTLQEVGVRSGDQIYLSRKRFTREDLSLILQFASVALTIAIFINTMD